MDNGNGLKVFPARLDQVTPIVDLVNSAYRGKNAGWTTEHGMIEGDRTDHSSLIQLLSAPDYGSHQVVLVSSLLEGAIVGTVHLQRSDRDAGVVFLGMFSVRPDVQNQRLGFRMLEAAYDWMRENWGSDIKRVEIGVIRQRAELIAWYERRGYQRTGDTEKFPYDNPSVGKPLRDDLELIILRRSI